MVNVERKILWEERPIKHPLDELSKDALMFIEYSSKRRHKLVEEVIELEKRGESPDDIITYTHL